MTTTVTHVRTRYATHPGSNVGDILATSAGRTHRRRIDQSQPLDVEHAAAARTLADRLGYAAHTVELDHTTDRQGTTRYVWRVVETWPAAVAALGDTYAVSYVGRTADASGWEHDKWHAVFTRAGRILEVPYRASTGHNGVAPTAADVLAAYLSDADAGLMTFARFCDEFGEDPDSRAAERTWRACAAAEDSLTAWLPADVLATLREARDAAQDAGAL